jgi:hypothetical protein
MKLSKIWKIKTKKTTQRRAKGGKVYKTEKTSYRISCSFINTADNNIVPSDFGRVDAPEQQ